MDLQILRELHHRHAQAVHRQVQVRHAQVRARRKSLLRLRQEPLQDRQILQEPLRQHVQAVLRLQVWERHVQLLRKSLRVQRITDRLRRHRQELRAQHAQVHRQARRKATAASQAAARRQVQEVTRHQAVADRAAVRLHVQVTQAHRIRVLQVRQDRAIPALLAQAVRVRHIQEVHLLTHQEDS